MIEVLVVIAVIAVLSAIAVPVLQKSKQQGSDLVCMSNLRQLGVALSVYCNENAMYPQGFCGDPTCHPSIPSEEYALLGTELTKDWQNSSWWFHLLNGIIEEDFSKNGPLRCPARRLADPAIADNILCSNYGINYAICKITASSTEEFYGNPLRTERVGSPSGKLLLMDAGYTLVSWKVFAPDASADPFVLGFELPARQGSYYLPGAAVNAERYVNGSIEQIQQDDALKGRHSADTFNAVFADGHVDRQKSSAVEHVFDDDGNFMSISPWAP